MRKLTLLKANIRRQKGTFIGLFLLVLITSMALCALLAIYDNSHSYEMEELNRTGYEEIAAWTGNGQDFSYLNNLIKEIENLPDVDGVTEEKIIYSRYSVAGKEADYTLQMKSYEKEAFRYYLLKDDLSEAEKGELQKGEAYVPVSFQSLFHARTGDYVEVYGGMKLKIRGFFEDPSMGGSMMGMKQIFISEEDFKSLEKECCDNKIIEGSQLHIYQKEESSLSLYDLQKELNEKTDLKSYSYFAYSKEAVAGFMLILINIFCGFIGAFVLILLIISIIVLGHSIGSSMKQNYKDIGILKVIGYEKKELQRLELVQYLLPIVLGMAAGCILSNPLIHLLSRFMLPVVGIRVPAKLPVAGCLLLFGGILILLAVYIQIKTIGISRVSPIQAIRGTDSDIYFKSRLTLPIYRKVLNIWLAIRQFTAGKKEYISMCMITALLVFFMSLAGRMNAWLGKDGEGLMQSFGITAYNFSVLYENVEKQEEAEQLIESLSGIKEQFKLLQLNASAEDMSCVMNVISEPERYQIIKGKTCIYANEVVMTEMLADTLQVNIGDSITVTYGDNSAEYTISGFNECANDMGQNFSLSEEGFARISTEKESYYQAYILKDSSKKDEIIEKLGSDYGVVDTNWWSGAKTINDTAHTLVWFMYGLSLIFILVVILMTGSKILYKEKRDLGIYKSLGFSSNRLRSLYALRFGIAATIGAVIGTLLSELLTDPLVTFVLKMCGISRFTSNISFLHMMKPGVEIVIATVILAYLTSGKIKKMNTMLLVVE